MTKGTGYRTFNAPNRSWTVRSMAQRLTSNVFLTCCAIPCYPNRADNREDNREDIREAEESKEKLQGVEDSERKGQLEMKRVASNDTVTSNQVSRSIEDGCALLEKGNYEGSGELDRERSCTDSEDRTFVSSATLFGMKRSLPVLSKPRKKNGRNQAKGFQSDGESSLPDIFSKCRLKKPDEQKSLSSYSELFPKCLIRKTSQQRNSDNSSEDGTSRSSPRFAFPLSIRAFLNVIFHFS